MGGRALAVVSSLVQPASIGALLERSGTTTYVLGILYLLALIYAIRRFCTGWRAAATAPLLSGGRAGREVDDTGSLSIWGWVWDIPRLFLASVVFALFTRTLSFITLAILALENVRFTDNNNSDNVDPTDQAFYQRVLAVLFNTGDWAAISTYLLLVVTWVEILQRGRKHFFNQSRIRRDWMISFLVVNSCLYMAQIGLYVAVFTKKEQQDGVLQAIYAVIAFLNLGIPLVLLVAWVVYSVMFAGFPYRSAAAKQSVMHMNRLVVGWTLGRVVWAVIAVLAANDTLIQAVADQGDWLFALVTGTVFVVAELVPYLASLGTHVIHLLAGEGVSEGAAQSRASVGEGAGEAEEGTVDDDETASVLDGGSVLTGGDGVEMAPAMGTSARVPVSLGTHGADHEGGAASACDHGRLRTRTPSHPHIPPTATGHAPLGYTPPMYAPLPALGVAIGSTSTKEASLTSLRSSAPVPGVASGGGSGSRDGMLFAAAGGRPGVHSWHGPTAMHGVGEGPGGGGGSHGLRPTPTKSPPHGMLTTPPGPPSLPHSMRRTPSGGGLHGGGAADFDIPDMF